MNQDIEKHRATLPVGRQSELCKASLALRQALAQPEQVLTARVVVSGSEHKPWCDSVTKLLLSYPPQIPSCNCKQEQGSSSPNYPISESSTPFVDTVNTSQAIVEYDRQGNIAQLFGPIEPDGTLLYAAPPKREWVGLTDEEVGAWPVWSPEIEGFVRKIEAKLKEKNCG